MADPSIDELLDSGTRRLVRSVDAMSDDQWDQPSLLPGWNRAHVVAHLTLNAEALSAALDGVRAGRAVPMYASVEARNADIMSVGSASAPELRDRFMATTTVIAEHVAELADNLAATDIERTPGGPRFSAGDVGWMRVREVEIHHADLALDYSAADWPASFVTMLLGWRASSYSGTPFTARATDLGRSWAFGTGGPTVSGPATALAWWASGRPVDQVPGGDGLTSDDGRMPEQEPM